MQRRPGGIPSCRGGKHARSAPRGLSGGGGAAGAGTGFRALFGAGRRLGLRPLAPGVAGGREWVCVGIAAVAGVLDVAVLRAGWRSIIYYLGMFVFARIKRFDLRQGESVICRTAVGSQTDFYNIGHNPNSLTRQFSTAVSANLRIFTVIYVDKIKILWEEQNEHRRYCLLL